MVVTAPYAISDRDDEGARHSGIESIENVAELGLGGVPPLFDDTPAHAAPAQQIPAGSTQEST
jgi:hypothetical protein